MFTFDSTRSIYANQLYHEFSHHCVCWPNQLYDHTILFQMICSTQYAVKSTEMSELAQKSVHETNSIFFRKHLKWATCLPKKSKKEIKCSFFFVFNGLLVRSAMSITIEDQMYVVYAFEEKKDCENVKFESNMPIHKTHEYKCYLLLMRTHTSEKWFSWSNLFGFKAMT